MNRIHVSRLALLSFTGRRRDGTVVFLHIVPNAPIRSEEYGCFFDGAGQKLAAVDRDRDGNLIVEPADQPVDWTATDSDLDNVELSF